MSMLFSHLQASRFLAMCESYGEQGDKVNHKKVNLDVKKRQRILIFFPVKEYAYYAATGKRYKYWYKYCIIHRHPSPFNSMKPVCTRILQFSLKIKL